jgi:glucokinase
MTILAGDVGGTKTVLTLYETAGGALEVVRGATFPSQAFGALEDVLVHFLDASERKDLRAACFGVPGAVIDGRCKTTNLPWMLDEVALAAALGAPKVKLLNDLEAAAYGMLHLRPDELAPLTPPDVVARNGNIAVIAAGTGLGEAWLHWDGWSHHPIACEGGHTTFAPSDDVEVALLQHLRAKLGGHVSWERVLSGPGLANVYAFLRDTGRGEESAVVKDEIAEDDVGAVVGRRGVEGSDPLCVAAVELFARLYGSEAGNMALKMLTTGGVYVGGGVAPKILPVLQKGQFLAGFRDKGRFRALLETIPVVVATNSEAPLVGAAHFAARIS